jgi:hypothetical protein
LNIGTTPLNYCYVKRSRLFGRRLPSWCHCPRDIVIVYASHAKSISHSYVQEYLHFKPIER